MKKMTSLIAALVAVVLLMTGCLGSGKSNEEDPNAPPTFASEPGDDRMVGDFEVEVVSVTIAERNGRDSYLVARISYTNHTDSNAVFKENLQVAMFQDGVLLDDASPSGLEGFDLEASRKTIKPGATLQVDIAFKPENLTSDVEVEVYIKGNYYVDNKATNKVRADYYGATMQINGSQLSNTTDIIAAERQAIIDEWEAEQARQAEETSAAEAGKNGE